MFTFAFYYFSVFSKNNHLFLMICYYYIVIPNYLKRSNKTFKVRFGVSNVNGSWFRHELILCIAKYVRTLTFPYFVIQKACRCTCLKRKRTERYTCYYRNVQTKLTGTVPGHFQLRMRRKPTEITSIYVCANVKRAVVKP